MSCLTKKSLFFMVLSILCSPTFAARTPDEIAECERNVRLVYYQDLDPFDAINLSMHWFSLDFINSMTNTKALSDALLQQFETFKDEFGQNYTRDSTVIANKIGNQNVEITEKARTDIVGYFKRLIVNFEKIYRDFHKEKESPAKFCEVTHQYLLPVCRSALSTLLQISDEELNGIDAVYAFKHCYLNRTFNDISSNDVISALCSSSPTLPDYQSILIEIQQMFSESGSSSSSSSTNIPNYENLLVGLRALFSTLDSSRSTFPDSQSIRLALQHNNSESGSSSSSSSTTIPNYQNTVVALKAYYLSWGGSIDTMPNDQQLMLGIQTKIAKNYFSTLMGKISVFAVLKYGKNSLFIQTVEKYCSSEN